MDIVLGSSAKKTFCINGSFYLKDAATTLYFRASNNKTIGDPIISGAYKTTSQDWSLEDGWISLYVKRNTKNGPPAYVGVFPLNPMLSFLLEPQKMERMLENALQRMIKNYNTINADAGAGERTQTETVVVLDWIDPPLEKSQRGGRGSQRRLPLEETLYLIFCVSSWEFNQRHCDDREKVVIPKDGCSGIRCHLTYMSSQWEKPIINPGILLGLKDFQRFIRSKELAAWVQLVREDPRVEFARLDVFACEEDPVLRDKLVSEGFLRDSLGALDDFLDQEEEEEEGPGKENEDLEGEKKGNKRAQGKAAGGPPKKQAKK